MRRFVAVITTAAIVAACTSSSSSAPSKETSPSQAASSQGAAPSASSEAAAVSGTAVLSGWQASPAEGNALTQTLLDFQAANPNIKVDYQPIAGDYATVMATNFASHDVPDVFYVNADYAQQWIDQGFLSPLDDYIAKSNFDTSPFFPGYASIFKGTDGKTYGFPKDGSTIGMAYNSSLVTAAPASMADLVTTAGGLKGAGKLKAPICLNPGLDRGLAFLYAQGGSLLSADGKTEQISTPASKAAVQWYLDLFKNGQGMTASDMGDGWCGDALGKGDAAIAFEGAWLDGAMTSAYPDTKYAWGVVPTGTSGSPVTIHFTVSYSIGADSKNKDQGWALLSYLTGKDGMTAWTGTGAALPSRTDVPPPKGSDVLVSEAPYSKPGSGFMPHWDAVQKAFQDAMTKEIQGKTFSADPVVAATAAAITAALQ